MYCLYERKMQIQFRSTFRTCLVSTGAHECIFSLTKLVTLSQFIKETLFYCQCFLIFGNKLLNFNFSKAQNSFLKLHYRFFLLFFNYKLSPFQRWSINILRFSTCICAFLTELNTNIISWMSEEMITFLANNVR